MLEVDWAVKFLQGIYMQLSGVLQALICVVLYNEGK